MSKTKLLLNVIEDIRRLGDSLQAIHQAMVESEGDKKTEVEVENIETRPEEITDNTVNSSEAVEENLPAATLEDVRAVLAKKSQEGKTALVRELIAQYGVTKLSEVDEKYYAELMKKAEEL